MNTFSILELWDEESRLTFFKLKGKKISSGSNIYKSEKLSDAVKELGLIQQPVILIAPRNLVTVRFIEVPSIEPEEISNIVEFQAQRELPFSKEEIVVGFRNLGTHKEGYSWILMAITNREKINEKIGFVESIGLKIDRISLSTELLFLWARDLISKEVSNLILDVHKSNTELLIIDHGRLVFSRAFSNTALSEELNRSLETYKREKLGNFIEECILTGDFEDLQTLPKSIEQNLNIKTKTCHFDLVGFVGNNLRFFESLEIDLTAKELKEHKLKRLKKQNLIFFLIRLSIILFLIFGALGFRLFEKRLYIKELDRKIESIEPESSEVEKILKKIDAVRLYTEQKTSAVSCLAELYKVIPENINLTSLSYDESKMVLQGTSRDMSYILKFINTLEKSQVFFNVELKFATKRSSSEGEFTDFQIVCLLEQ